MDMRKYTKEKRQGVCVGGCVWWGGYYYHHVHQARKKNTKKEKDICKDPQTMVMLRRDSEIIKPTQAETKLTEEKKIAYAK